MAWTNVGNIKGPKGDPGDVAGIPDPLVLNEMHANNTLYINGKLRWVATPAGGELQWFNGTAWIPQQTIP